MKFRLLPLVNSIVTYLVVLGLLMYSCGTKDIESSDTITLKIATAANMQVAMDSITGVFTETQGITCSVTSNSSGMLTAQIQNGAPYDLFVSANMRYPNELVKSGFGDSVSVYAFGKLVLIYANGKKYGSPEDLLMDSKIRRIGVPDDKTAPYGIAAESYLKKSGIRSKIAQKIVVGESVGQVNQYIKTKAVDAAFTSYSFVHKFEEDYQVMELDQELYSEIEQGALILKSGKKNHPIESKAFFDFLSSDKCQDILTHFGYTIK